jgi:hypothetical protein
LAWLLATCRDARRRDPDQAVERARKAVHQAPKAGTAWKIPGVALYRIGDWKAAVAALEKSLGCQGRGCRRPAFPGRGPPEAGQPDEPRKSYERAVAWLERNEETLEKDRAYAEELRRFRAEAEEVLERKKA